MARLPKEFLDQLKMTIKIGNHFEAFQMLMEKIFSEKK